MDNKRTFLSGVVLFLVIVLAAFMGGCTTAQVQQAETEVSTGLSIISGMLDGVYASAEVYCNSGQIQANTCANLKADYMAAQTAISAVNTLSHLDNSSNVAASTQATAAVLSAYFAIASAINTNGRQWKTYGR
ncbi:hypothetical protein [Candidatus Magnetominusculus xianensis]|uniref:Secreted protein n=1 Tax=Candidatus Magnetominusculus xianensis TaxID=1748249 RepID=A0ABR5SAN9_9BACT|nr:hypothetical protein [Candidatus Magnetominusculus xianensis]KWT73780.1 hypothetical protein ASN18_3362 [Candidatus Magnetominusculus xianensis]MBF0404801.1 hypothetical protein [Nitrospirota bacterium]